MQVLKELNVNGNFNIQKGYVALGPITQVNNNPGSPNISSGSILCVTVSISPRLVGEFIVIILPNEVKAVVTTLLSLTSLTLELKGYVRANSV